MKTDSDPEWASEEEIEEEFQRTTVERPAWSLATALPSLFSYRAEKFLDNGHDLV